MELAVEQAKIAVEHNEVPVGATMVKDGKVLSFCHNRKNIDKVAVFHAEILCIIDACKKLNSWHLDGCELYVTLKPCKMCLYALAEARVNTVYYLLDSNYANNLNSSFGRINCISLNDDYNYKSMLVSFFNCLR